ncbi:MAG: imidazole glycerol phosphate synthase subunit HisH [Actinomycetaceae bacterium]|nr:imidazole glycerol phosphate synthase subunit HisH [Actinomycetaceae bacterium]
MTSVVVLDYGSGNVRSACRALEHVGAQVTLSCEAKAIEKAEGLVVPGVGSFKAVMRQLQDVDAPRIIDQRLAGGKAVLGICVGHQVLFSEGVEHIGAGKKVEGLAQWPGIVERLEAPVVPHTGWSPVRPPKGSRLFEGVEDQRFYFVHSYGVTRDPFVSMQDSSPLRAPQVAWAHHGQDFVAAVENGPLSSTQFHPEKSGEAGLRLLKNWINLCSTQGQ